MSVIFDTGKCKARLSGNIEKAQRALDAQVLKDSNYYVPFITGDLRDSSDATKIGTGVIEWKIKLSPFSIKILNQLLHTIYKNWR